MNYQEVLTKAREYFYKLDPNIIGINIAHRRVKHSSSPDEFALVVYVLQKKPHSELDPAKVIPKEFLGLKTDVYAPLSADAPEPTGDFFKDRAISADMRAIDWVRVHELAMNLKASPTSTTAPIVQDFGDVCVVENDGTLQPVPRVVDFVRAYQLFRTLHRDDYDFVTFFIDEASGLESRELNGGSFFSSIFNDVKGIGREPFNARHAWDTSRLEGFHVMKFNGTWRHTMLQEFGHRFAASVRYKDPDTGATMSDHLLEQPPVPPGHWSKWINAPFAVRQDHIFDDDKSPMDYGVQDWVEQSNGEFKTVDLNSDERVYCNLDLYLMGLLGPGEVGQFTLLRNVADVPGSPNFTATPVRLTVQDFIAVEGQRVPNVAVSPKNWRQAFIVLTNDIHKVHEFVETVDALRLRWEQDFQEATKGLGRVDTVLGRRFGGPADFTVVFAGRQQFGNEPGSLNIRNELNAIFVGASKEFNFACPKVNPHESAVLMFQSRAVSSRENIITINGINLSDGIPFNPDTGVWNGNVLVIRARILKPSGNVLRIEARNSSGGSGGNIDDFILDNMVVMYKTR
ncbi:MAG: hypothetical protein ACR2IE_11015 [Candidatus Sumerlaeaceae bacterium]